MKNAIVGGSIVSFPCTYFLNTLLGCGRIEALHVAFVCAPLSCIVQFYFFWPSERNRDVTKESVR